MMYQMSSGAGPRARKSVAVIAGCLDLADLLNRVKRLARAVLNDCSRHVVPGEMNRAGCTDDQT